VTENYEQFSIK